TGRGCGSRAAAPGDAMLDPYHKWLGIPKDQRPPTHYQLLGISPGEQDREVIEEASIRQTTHLRAYQIGAHTAECTRILNEVAQARRVLLDPAKRRAYDQSLANKSAHKAATDSSDPHKLVTAQAPPPKPTGFEGLDTDHGLGRPRPR